MTLHARQASDAKLVCHHLLREIWDVQSRVEYPTHRSSASARLINEDALQTDRRMLVGTR
jgi:hypothetical protein